MQLHVIARGKIGRSPENELVERYARRIPWPLTITELPEKGGRIPQPKAMMRRVLLDECGKQLTSEHFADQLASWRDQGVREVQLLVGAADGHDKALRESADLVLAYGKATWPHLLVRAMVVEQIYRATTILAGHPYHRSG